MKRALLIWNPTATTTSPGVRDVIARALMSELHVELAETMERGHATDLAADGAASGEFDMVAVLGGDGTINEAVNGLAGTDIVLATIPGGGTNVLARTLGYPKDPVEATSVLIAKIREGEPPRTISLGRVSTGTGNGKLTSGRAFTFCAGAGFDADVVRLVESNPRTKRRLGEMFFVTSALRNWLTPGRDRIAKMSLRFSGEILDDVKVAVIGNSDPFTYLGSKPFRLVPSADIERPSLDVTALVSLRPIPVGRTLVNAFGRGSTLRHRSVRSIHDVTDIHLVADRDVPLQVDGDFAGWGREFRFWSDPASLRVLA